MVRKDSTCNTVIGGFVIMLVAKGSCNRRAKESLVPPPHTHTHTQIPVSWSLVSEGFVGDPWLSITLTLCHILHSVSHWPVLVYYFNTYTERCSAQCMAQSNLLCHISHVGSHWLVLDHLINLFTYSRLHEYFSTSHLVKWRHRVQLIC
jgi:hypothetical protein